ncbi:uncharacterized protein LOC110940924 isoform X1 [Helianthus annuus]|uniref:uncharacterized protein LOC110940924 isoform X1 n=1 Tax=Helianthus annuus TaxID=4232 RepID=UPI000B8F35AC|nr:uncharacterized protein LOC110940924 isoform X1 [Helianthus annuus]
MANINLLLKQTHIPLYIFLPKTQTHFNLHLPSLNSNRCEYDRAPRFEASSSPSSASIFVTVIIAEASAANRHHRPPALHRTATVKLHRTTTATVKLRRVNRVLLNL